MAAFSAAMASRVSPRMAGVVQTRLPVMAATRGESDAGGVPLRPPSPTSSTAVSTPRSRKSQSAEAVSSSNSVEPVALPMASISAEAFGGGNGSADGQREVIVADDGAADLDALGYA